MSRKSLIGLGGLAALLIIVLAVGAIIKAMFNQREFPVHASMHPLQATEHPLVIRTDFSNDAAWENVLDRLAQPVNLGMIRAYAYLEILNDPAHANTSPEMVRAQSTEYAQEHSFLIIADATTMTHPEQILLVVDLDQTPGRSFRAPPHEITLIENNLSISNMDFADFADYVDANGVYRGGE